MRKFILPVLIVILSACNRAEDRPGIKEDAADSTGIVNKSTSASFDETLFKEINLPLVIDTDFILEADTNDRIPYQQIRQLGTNFLNHDLSSGLSYDINTFCEIDSIKRAGLYNEYLEKLDIGMTKIAISFKIGVIKFRDGTRLFLWGVHNSSFEACPFFAGTTIVGTYLNPEKKNTHFVIGEVSGGGDPPAIGDDEVTSKINADGKIEIKGLSVNDDLDVPGDERTTQELTLQLQADSIKIIKSKKETKSTEAATTQ